MTITRSIPVVLILFLATVQTVLSKEVKITFRGEGGNKIVLIDCNVELRKRWIIEGGRNSGYEYEMAISTVKHAKEIYDFCDGKVGRVISVYLDGYLVGSPVLVERIGDGRLAFKLKEDRVSKIKSLLSGENEHASQP